MGEENSMWSIKELQTWSVLAEINGRWVSARPLNWKHRAIIERLREAWKVFWGKADCFVWPEGQ